MNREQYRDFLTTFNGPIDATVVTSASHYTVAEGPFDLFQLQFDATASDTDVELLVFVGASAIKRVTVPGAGGTREVTFLGRPVRVPSGSHLYFERIDANANDVFSTLLYRNL